MIGHIANLVRWEWFKQGRRWMPWILLVVLVMFSQLLLWGSFFSYRSVERQTGPQLNFGGPGGVGSTTVDCTDLLAGRPVDLPPNAPPGALEDLQRGCERWTSLQQQQLQEMRGGFTLPGSLVNALTVAQAVGLFLLAILTASVIGTDYGWGTLRSVLVRGTGRWQYLAAKLFLLALLAAGALVVVVVLAALTSILAGIIAGVGVTSTAVGWGDVPSTFGRMWVALLPYGALAAAITVLTNSTAAGTGITLAYNFAEPIAVAIFINLFDWFQPVTDYLLGRNISAWVLGGQPEGARSGFLMLAGIGELPGEAHALAVLLVYVVALGGLAFWLFQRRDVKGDSGA